MRRSRDVVPKEQCNNLQHIQTMRIHAVLMESHMCCKSDFPICMAIAGTRKAGSRRGSQFESFGAWESLRESR